MRGLVSALVMAVVTGCSLPGHSGRGSLRSFYLTKDSVQGNQAAGACARGYHMASRFEIWDVSLLDYDTSRGLTTDDSGAGPPSQAAQYGSVWPSGWVRTGGGSQYTDPAAAPGSAFTNCAAWSSNSGQAYGTVAYLTDKFPSAGSAGVWNGGSEHCDIPHHVWCVSNPGNPEPEPDSSERRRRRRSE
jgi:hypothetical protein